LRSFCVICVTKFVQVISCNLPITKIEVPESDAYAVPGQSLDTIVKDIKHGAAGFEVSRIPEFIEDDLDNKSSWSDLKKKRSEVDRIDASPSKEIADIPNQYEPVTTESVDKIAEAEVTAADAGNEESERTGSVETDDSLLDTDTDMNSELTDQHDNQSTQSVKFELNDIRLPLGTITGSSQIVNWEYGNRNLPNRHMLVSGKSGQGKTYFMQGLLLEMKKQNISSLVIDYSDSYRIGQLDPQFIQKMGSNIVNNIVAVNGIALNPFKRVVVDYGDGLILPEDIGVTAERVAQTLDFVFNLGAQQHSALVDLIADGINDYGDNYGFEQLREQLKADKANTLYGRLQPLLISNVFKKTDKEFNWADFFKNDGTMNIIQLFNIPRRVQNAVTEFLLWDLFHYAQSSGGDESQPLPVFLDEVQNLSFDQDSPAVKILREGRKFGISGIFATQSIASIKGSDKDSVWNAALQMHFLPPEDQVVMLSKSISADKVEREQIEQRLRNLQKGHALLRGPVMGPNGLVQQVNEVNILQIDRR
jgi:DNA phosphorothioation-dependent restriction protein DptH